MYRKTYVEINLNNLENNVKTIIEKFNNYQYYFGIVKGNAYGHGSYIVNTIIESGINYLAVSSLEEAIDVRKYNKDIPILCLEPIDLSYIKECIDNNVTLTINDYDYYNNLIKIKINKQIKVHLKIDSGMNRIGLKDKNEIKDIFDNLINSKNILLEGIYTHLATSGINDKYYDNQIENFKNLTCLIDLSKIKIVHISRSMSFFNHEKIDIANGIRIGISMYGINPLPIINNKGLKQKLRNIKNNIKRKKLNISKTIDNSNIELKPCLKFCSEVIQVKKIKKDEFVGYGSLYKAKADTYIATIAAGYSDGFRRSNVNNYVLINNKKYKIAGEIGMGMFSVECDETIKKGNIVTLIGDDINIRNVSRHNNTTAYETMCNIDKFIPRIYVKDNKIIKEINHI